MTKPKIPGVCLAPGLPPRHVFEVGQRIGRAVVIDVDVRIPRPGRKVPRRRGDRGVRLVCDCGNEFVRAVSGLVRYRDSNASCGCEAKRPKWRDAPNRAARNGVLKLYQTGACKRGLSWELTDEDFDRLTALDCYYCGGPPSAMRKSNQTYENGDFIYTGIDRKDNALGYTPENVVPSCAICNRAKSSMPYGDFMTWVARLTAYQWFHPEMTPSPRLKAVM